MLRSAFGKNASSDVDTIAFPRISLTSSLPFSFRLFKSSMSKALRNVRNLAELLTMSKIQLVSFSFKGLGVVLVGLTSFKIPSCPEPEIWLITFYRMKLKSILCSLFCFVVGEVVVVVVPIKWKVCRLNRIKGSKDTN